MLTVLLRFLTSLILHMLAIMASTPLFRSEMTPLLPTSRVAVDADHALGRQVSDCKKNWSNVFVWDFINFFRNTDIYDWVSKKI